MRIEVKAEVQDVMKSMKGLQKNQLPFAASLAINKTLFKVKKQLEKDMSNTFRGGSERFTKQGLQFKKSHKTNLTGFIFLAPKQFEYLKYQIYGGVRPKKGGESIPIPYRNRVATNRFGNLTKSKIRQLLSAKANKVLILNGVRGIYKTFKDGRRPMLLIALNDKTVTYRGKKFAYFYLVQRAAKRFFRKEMEKAAERALKTQR